MEARSLRSVMTLITALCVVEGCAYEIGTEPDEVSKEQEAVFRGPYASIGCTANVASGLISCEKSKDSSLGLSPQFLIVGGQGIHVQLSSSNVSYDAGTEVFQADVAVQNLRADPLGTPDGSTNTGIRVFFHSGPSVTTGTGSVTVSNSDGSGTFTGSEQPYYQYDEILTTGETSAVKTWTWSVPPTVITFDFSVFIHADVPNQGLIQWPLLALGDVQTCALVPSNDVWCWGENGEGVFGNGTLVGDSVPIPGAVGLRLRSLSLAIRGADTACGVSLPGDVYCWGSNSYGVLGPGAGSWTPQLVASTMGFTVVELGEKHACGLTSTGDAYCWGDNSWGNIGDGTTMDRTTPTAVATSLTFSDIQAGDGYSCALAVSGTVYCWGSNLSGQLGDGTTSDRSLPDSVLGGISFVRISMGNLACGIDTSGDAYCWGAGATVPALVPGSLKVQDISAGDTHTCLVDDVNAGWCWGEGEDGQLGTGDSLSRTVPTAMVGGLQWKTITAEEQHTCGVTIANDVYCWGANYDGQLGIGSTASSSVPVKVLGLP